MCLQGEGTVEGLAGELVQAQRRQGNPCSCLGAGDAGQRVTGLFDSLNLLAPGLFVLGSLQKVV